MYRGVRDTGNRDTVKIYTVDREDIDTDEDRDGRRDTDREEREKESEEMQKRRCHRNKGDMRPRRYGDREDTETEEIQIQCRFRDRGDTETEEM